MKKFLLLILTISIVNVSKADVFYMYSEKGLWTAFFIQKKINAKFFFTNELQFRIIEKPENLQQIIVRPSISFKLKEYIDLSVGASYSYNGGYNRFSAYKDGNEINTWQQIATNNQIAWLHIKTRLRFEERFTRPNFQSDYSFHNRLRTQIELGHVFKKFSIFLYNEIFWLNKAVVHQNWFGFITNYNFSEKWSVNLGLMNQYLYRNYLSAESNFILRIGAKLKL